MSEKGGSLVVVISGDDADIEKKSRWFAETLQKEFALSVRCIGCATMNLQGLRAQLKSVFRSGNTSPLLVVYNGHGSPIGWAPWSNRPKNRLNKMRMTYSEIARLARDYAGPLLFVNSACFAYKLGDAFQEQKLPVDRVGVIAACDSGRTTIGDILLNQVFDAWRAGHGYRAGYMGETYSIPSGTKPLPVHFAVPVSLLTWFRHMVLRSVFSLWSVVHPMEHETFFSKRWGARIDHLFFEQRCSFGELEWLLWFTDALHKSLPLPPLR
jgi:hypothetical protein